MNLQTIEMIGGASIVLSVVSGIIFYIKSIKYFRPSELIAILKNEKEDTGSQDKQGKEIYSFYNFEQGGRHFLPFWKEYYVLPTGIITSTIKTGTLLMEDKLKVSVEIVFQYHIDISSDEKKVNAFTLFDELVKVKNKNNDIDTVSFLKKQYEPIARSKVAVVIGKMNLDKIIEHREEASGQLKSIVQSSFRDSGLIVTTLEIQTIEILSKEYSKILEAREAMSAEKEKLYHKRTLFDIEKINMSEKHKLELHKLELDKLFKIAKIKAEENVEAFKKNDK